MLNRPRNSGHELSMSSLYVLTYEKDNKGTVVYMGDIIKHNLGLTIHWECYRSDSQTEAEKHKYLLLAVSFYW